MARRNYDPLPALREQINARAQRAYRNETNRAKYLSRFDRAEPSIRANYDRWTHGNTKAIRAAGYAGFWGRVSQFNLAPPFADRFDWKRWRREAYGDRR